MIRSRNNSTVGLPKLTDSKYIHNQVQRRIKNKIQPLAYKFYVLKSGRCLAKKQNNQNSFNIYNNKAEDNIHKIRNRQTQHKQNLKKYKQIASSSSRAKINFKQTRRKAVVQVFGSLNEENFTQLQSKVQHHIMLKKMDIMEDQFAYAEQCGKKQKQLISKKLRSSPIQKYVFMFQKSERPSQKINRVAQASCQQMLKQIKTAKSIKHIQCMQQNMRNLINNDTIQKKRNKQQSTKNKHIKSLQNTNANISFNYNSNSKSNLNLNTKQSILSAKHQKKVNKKLKQDILKDIKKQYQIQGSSKIRININHKKMIQLML